MIRRRKSEKRIQEFLKEDQLSRKLVRYVESYRKKPEQDRETEALSKAGLSSFTKESWERLPNG